MLSFHHFICQRAAASPVLVGECSHEATAAATNAHMKELLSKSESLPQGSPSSVEPLSEESMSTIMRSLVAPLHPFGAGHLLHNSVWPAFLAAEAVASAIGERRRVVDETSEAEQGLRREEEEKYSAVMFDLERAISKLMTMTAALESYTS